MEQSDINTLMNMGKSSKKAKAAFSDAKSASDDPTEKKPAEDVSPPQTEQTEQPAQPVETEQTEQTPAKQESVAPAPAPVAPAPAPAVPAPVAPAPVAPVPAAPVASAPAVSTVPKSVSSASSSAAPKADKQARVVSEITSVTAVTERETNKVMDKLDMISQSLDHQKNIITGIMGHESVQNPVIQSAIQQIMSAASDIQNKIYDAMDLMQFQDITRQKLERIILHLRQIHDYIVELLGTGFKSEPHSAHVSISHTIAQTGTTPDENKDHADSVVEEFLQTKK
jgi:chemotaxis regulatin CheY-phosphate phosphatase CheZ